MYDIMSLGVYFDKTKVINGMTLSLPMVQREPRLNFIQSAKQYTILMIDPDAPSRNNPIHKYWLHWLIVNNDKTIADYEPPTPPKGSGPHRYFILLLEQTIKFSPNEIGPIIQRNNFDVPEFIHKHHLKLIASIYFVSEN